MNYTYYEISINLQLKHAKTLKALIRDFSSRKFVFSADSEAIIGELGGSRDSEMPRNYGIFMVYKLSTVT